MKYGFHIIVCLLIFLMGCSKDEPAPPVIEESGNLEVHVTLENVFFMGATVTTVPATKTMITDSQGPVVFKDIKTGKYEVVVAVPNHDETYFMENVEVKANETESLFLELLSPPVPIEPIQPDLAQLTQIAYDNLRELFDASDYITYWGDIGVDVFLTNPGGNPNLSDLDFYNFTPSNTLIENVWATHYRAILDINKVLDAIANSNYEPNPEVKTAEAELRFLRALSYFNLVKLFGNPVVVSSAKIDLLNPPSYPQDAQSTYDLIVQDLIYAENNLNSDGSYYEATKGAAQALLGKVYLQMAGYPLLQTDKYALALAQFKKIEGLYELTPNYGDIFNVESETTNSEVIFGIGFDSGSELTAGEYGIVWGPLGTTARDDLSLVPGFGSSYPDNPEDLSTPVTFPIQVDDQRFFRNIATFKWDNGMEVDQSDPDNWRPYKFMSDKGGNKTSIDYPYMRYAEVLLMLAEAENAVNGPTQVALNAINKVRRRAFGNSEHDISTGLTQEEFLEAVLKERKLELCLEGHRKDDLIRTQRLEAVIQEFNANSSGNQRNFQSHEYIWPIPQREIDLNPNVVQNPGY